MSGPRPRVRYDSLAGASVFVTGGAAGIGAAIVRAFAAQGACIAFADIDGAAAAALGGELAGGGANVLPLACDITDEAALRAAITRAADAHGPVTVLVNNAGDDSRHRFETLDAAGWARGLAVNLGHHVVATQAVLPMMRAAGGGAVVNMGSIGWRIATPDLPAYHAAKAAIEGLTRSLARDHGPDNVRVMCVAPGWIMTERQRSRWMTPEGHAQLMAAQCLKRELLPEEVASVVLFLASSEASACTGQTFIVDAGWAH